MATPTNGTGNLVDEFEEAFLSLMQVLAKEEENFNSLERDENRVDIDQASLKFLDIARQLESFFLQKRFVLSALKPELIMKEETAELRLELQRKDELLKRHYEKISVWQNMLTDLQSYAKSQGPGVGHPSPVPSGSGPPQMNNIPPPTAPGAMSGGPMTGPPPTPSNPALMNAIQQLQQHQQQQQQQQQQQLQMQQQQQQQQHMHQQQLQQMQQQMSVGIPGNGAGPGGNVGPMLSPQQAMFMQQQQNIAQRASPFANQGAGNMLGPLAFLEKTTSNIGMPDGRR